MARLDPQIRKNSDWQTFLRLAPSGSRVETELHLQELDRGADFAQTSTGMTGFDQHLVADFHSNRARGHHLMPALVTKDWLLIPQVTVLTPAKFTLDCLVVVQHPHRTFIDLEVDGSGHDSSEDKRRHDCLGMPTLRLTEAQVLSSVGLTEHLRELGYCQTRRPQGKR